MSARWESLTLGIGLGLVPKFRTQVCPAIPTVVPIPTVPIFRKIDWNAAQLLCSFLIDTVTSFRPVRRHSIKKNHKNKIIPYWFLLIKLICQTNTILIYSFICAMGKQSKCPSFDRERKLSRGCARLPHLCPGFPATQPSSVCVFFFVNFVLSYF